jgi:hypothetical protein
MKRRDFIISTVAGVGVISASAYYLFGDVEYDAALADPHSLALIWDTKTISDIGKQYRINNPDESSPRTLVKLLNTASPNDETITNDFAAGKIVIVDGWMLSQTEARQCALASTQQPK